MTRILLATTSCWIVIFRFSCARSILNMSRGASARPVVKNPSSSSSVWRPVCGVPLLARPGERTLEYKTGVSENPKSCTSAVVISLPA